MTSFHFNGELAAAIGTNDVDVATSVEQRLEAYLENVAGDITGVTAGLGISGGGTSGTVTVAFAPSELSTATVAVSYTHLRAHETLRYLVWRLQVEKKM